VLNGNLPDKEYSSSSLGGSEADRELTTWSFCRYFAKRIHGPNGDGRTNDSAHRKNRSKERIATAEAVASFEDFRRQQLDVISKTKASYFPLANIYLLLDLNDQEEPHFPKPGCEQGEIRGRYAIASRLFNADVERQKIIEARRDLEQKLSDEQTKLKVLMNRDPFSPLGRLVWSEALPPDLSTERLRRLTLANRPEVRQAQSMVIGASAKVELAKREWIPDPSVSLQAQHYNAGRQAISELMLGYRSIFPGLTARNTARANVKLRATC